MGLRKAVLVIFAALQSYKQLKQRAAPFLNACQAKSFHIPFPKIGKLHDDKLE
jgi:hypothetical protein